MRFCRNIFFCIIGCFFLFNSALLADGSGENPTLPSETAFIKFLSTLKSIDGYKIDSRLLKEFYAQQDQRPVWLKEGVFSKVKILKEKIKNSKYEGLDPKDYPLYSIQSRYYAKDKYEQYALDIILTQTFMDYTRHLTIGRTHPKKLRINWYIYPKEFDGVSLLSAALEQNDFNSYLSQLSPQIELYQNLKKALANYYSGDKKKEEIIRIPKGQTLRFGVRDKRVVLLRKRLNVTQKPNHNVYDRDVERAVKKFQRAHNIKVDGILGTRTLNRLNGIDRSVKVDKIILTMERLRWLPELEKRHIFVNVPEFKLRVFNGNDIDMDMNVIVGKPHRQTPAFNAKMTQLVVNPFWYVPPRIARDLYARGIGPSFIQSHTASGQPRLIQRPGPRNALGRLKFRMPNNHTIFLHDTPSRHLFKKMVRMFSSGCVRLERPLELAAYIMNLGEDEWTKERVQKNVSRGGNKSFNLPEKMPVYIVYLTAWADSDGNTTYFKDIYRKDLKIQQALNAREQLRDKSPKIYLALSQK